MKEKLVKMEITGIVFTFFTAIFLYFCYTISNHAVWSILVSAVNDSIWEHAKIFIFPHLLWTIIEICCIRAPMKRTIVAKTIGIYIFFLTAIFFYYIYSGILGYSLIIIDITGLILCLALSFYISLKLISSTLSLEPLFPASTFALILLLTMCITFSVCPPDLNLFKDPKTGLYGIVSTNVLPSCIYLDN